MDYYKKHQLIAAVDKNDSILSPIDKWEAHKKGILHRGFTVCLTYKNLILLQHRKHPVFDGYYDLACSSHPVYQEGKLQSFEEAIYDTLEREWNMKKSAINSKLVSKGSIYYKATDKLSAFIEHEICHLYFSTVTVLPSPNYEFAYGFSLLPKSTLINNKSPITKSFAPWVPQLLELF